MYIEICYLLQVATYIKICHLLLIAVYWNLYCFNQTLSLQHFQSCLRATSVIVLGKQLLFNIPLCLPLCIFSRELSYPTSPFSQMFFKVLDLKMASSTIPIQRPTVLNHCVFSFNTTELVFLWQVVYIYVGNMNVALIFLSVK